MFSFPAGKERTQELGSRVRQSCSTTQRRWIDQSGGTLAARELSRAKASPRERLQNATRRRQTGERTFVPQERSSDAVSQNRDSTRKRNRKNLQGHAIPSDQRDKFAPFVPPSFNPFSSPFSAVPFFDQFIIIFVPLRSHASDSREEVTCCKDRPKFPRTNQTFVIIILKKGGKSPALFPFFSYLRNPRCQSTAMTTSNARTTQSPTATRLLNIKEHFLSLQKFVFISISLECLGR